MQEAVLKSAPYLSGVDGEHRNKAIYELGQEIKMLMVKYLIN